MAQCAICGKEGGQTQLYYGIYDGKLNPVCYNCSINEGIALIKKPSKEQLEQAEKRQSVREMMEKMSSPQQKIMKKDSLLAHKNLSKLKFPTMKQEHEDLVQNYDWLIKQARRHLKISTAQLSEKAGIEKAQLESLEAVQIFTGFERVAKALENVLRIKLLKIDVPEVKLVRPAVSQRREIENSKEKSILDSVREKVKRQRFLLSRAVKENPAAVTNEYTELDEQQELDHDKIDIEQIRQQKEEEKIKRQKVLAEEIDQEKFDFSRRENLDKITLQDLADLKKLKLQREKLERDSD